MPYQPKPKPPAAEPKTPATDEEAEESYYRTECVVLGDEPRAVHKSRIPADGDLVCVNRDDLRGTVGIAMGAANMDDEPTREGLLRLWRAVSP
jgi:hypothetical protein